MAPQALHLKFIACCVSAALGGLPLVEKVGHVRFEKYGAQAAIDQPGVMFPSEGHTEQSSSTAQVQMLSAPLAVSVTASRVTASDLLYAVYDRMGPARRS